MPKGVFESCIREYMSYKDGVYIEAGANDGVKLSNTLFLEQEFNWSGLLVEPSHSAMIDCQKNRSSKNSFEECALVSDPNIKEIEGNFDGRLPACVSYVDDINPRLSDSAKDDPKITVQASTLSNVLDKNDFPNVIDFLSLDVKGYELEVLKGIDFKKYQFKYILTEVTYNFFGLKDVLEILEPAGMILSQTLNTIIPPSVLRADAKHRKIYLYRSNLLFFNMNLV